MTAALRDGTEKHFEVTRLTSLKSLCQEREIAIRLGLHLAEYACQQMQGKSPYSSLDDAEWERSATGGQGHRRDARLFAIANGSQTHGSAQTSVAGACGARRDRAPNEPVHRAHHSQHAPAGDRIRLECFLLPDPGYRAYQTARHYAERFDSRYGSGLNPESAPFLQDILRFSMPTMPETLQSSLPSPTELRAMLEAIVLKDLLGPAGGPEEIVEEANVRGRYIVGLLAPKGQSALPGDDDDNLTKAGTDTEDGKPDSASPKAATMLPSSIGMTFTVAGNAKEIQIAAHYGHYERAVIESSEDGWRAAPRVEAHPGRGHI